MDTCLFGLGTSIGEGTVLGSHVENPVRGIMKSNAEKSHVGNLAWKSHVLRDEHLSLR
jgi:hypothetical protein